MNAKTLLDRLENVRGMSIFGYWVWVGGSHAWAHNSSLEVVTTIWAIARYLITGRGVL